MRIQSALLVALATATLAHAQDNRDDLTPLEISYTTSLSDDLKSFHVDMVIENVKRPAVHVAMPAWMPGAYFIGNFGENVEDMRALGDEEVDLDVTRMSSGTWSVDTQGHSRVRVSYSIPAAGRRRFGPPREETGPITGRRINGPATYLYVEGAKGRPVTARYEMPDGWGIANGLMTAGDPTVRTARDYDTFIDAPTIVGHYIERSFEVNGTPFSCVFFENEQQYNFDVDAFVDIVRRIVTNTGQLYGSYPFPDYVFLFSLPGGGGLEHLNSTSIGLRAEAQKEDPEAGASVVAHEFFHAWNVKRIRPKVLGPFDYQQENYTGNLWVSEGWTSYFGDLSLVRSGVIDQDEFLKILEDIIEREQNKERRKKESVMWASRNGWHRYADEEGDRVDYYGKGEMLGALIDLKIRHETENRKSLNDFMRFMNRWFAEQNVGFEEHDVERACTAISNHDFGEFFARHVYGTMDPPLKEYLAYAGIDYSEDVIPCSFPFSLRGNRISGRPRPGDEEEPGPRPGEVIQKIDGEDFGEANAFLRTHAAGDVVLLTLGSRSGEGEPREVEVTLSETPIMIPTLTYRDDPTELQRAIRERWLTSVE